MEATKQEGQRKTLKEWIKELGIKKSWLATEARVAYPSLLGWVNGRAPLPDEYRVRLANAMRLSPEQIAQ